MSPRSSIVRTPSRPRPPPATIPPVAPPGLPVPRAHRGTTNNSVIATVRPATKQVGPQSSRNKGSTPAYSAASLEVVHR